jgi:hypothetical protein
LVQEGREKGRGNQDVKVRVRVRVGRMHLYMEG